MAREKRFAAGLVIGLFFLLAGSLAAQETQELNALPPSADQQSTNATATCPCVAVKSHGGEGGRREPGLKSRNGRWKVRPQRTKIENSTGRNFTVGPTCSRGGGGCEFEVIGAITSAHKTARAAVDCTAALVLGGGT